MFKMTTSSQEGLSRAEMDIARKVFHGKLAALRYSPQFIVRNGEDLLSIAHEAYVKAVEEGVEIEEPAAFVVHVASQRLKNLVRDEANRPGQVSSEDVIEVIDSGTPSPEEIFDAAERARKVRKAVAKLSEEQRRVIALTFFERFSIREAAKHLGCSPGKVQHHHRSALEQLRRSLPVHSSDELQIDVGGHAWISLAAGGSAIHQVPAGVEAILDRAGHRAADAWSRAHDVARRASSGGGGGGADAAGVVASTGAGRAAGACAAGLAALCLGASGIVPGVAIFGGHHRQRPAPPPAASVVSTRTASPSTTMTTSSATATGGKASAASGSRSSRRAGAGEGAGEGAQQKHEAEVTQVKSETSGISRAAAESHGYVPPASNSTDGGGEGETVVTVPATPSPSSAAVETSKAQTSEEFNRPFH
jgi:RNA polymerase sigma factor (sigma-70 family)